MGRVIRDQRNGRLFDKYPLSGKTYTTARGAVVPNELQYYDGEMVHLYGDCANVPAVNAALAGSGYKALTLRYPDNQQTAAGQLWASRFTDTSIGPYNAMFMVVIAVPDDATTAESSIAAHPNGASSTLPMLKGSFDPATAVYENTPRLFLVRLLDTTQIAIDVGRERMGTDKRPGALDMTHDGRRLHLSIADQNGRGVAKADLELASDPTSYAPEIAKAAATAGVSLQWFPPDTEYVYPAVARIGQGPIVSWQWRSDLAPRLQPVTPGTVVFDSSSEEGRMFLSWGFTPKVLGHFPNVRGLITGLADQMPRVPLLRARPADGPRDSGGLLPVLQLVGQKLSHTGAQIESPVSQARRVAASVDTVRSRPAVATAPQPRWAWGATFLGSLTARLRKEVVGATPDGLRINWHVIEGSFVGPGLDATILPGAADWMRIRRDGVAIVSVQACFETREGARVHGSYGGIFDLGPDGYARALRDEYDPLPPVVVTPTYATAEPQLEWLNRAQCVGVGRVDMAALRVEFDVYVMRVEGRTQPASPLSLYRRLGGYDVIAAVADDFLEWGWTDKHLGRFFVGHSERSLKTSRQLVVDLLCEATGGPCIYLGRDMKTTHKGIAITDADWKIAIDLFTAALDKHGVAPQEQSEFMQIIHDMKSQIVEAPGRS